MNNELKKNVVEMLKEIKNGGTLSALFLGQKYIKSDQNFFKNLSHSLDIGKEEITLNKLWENTDHKKLKGALFQAGIETNCCPFFRTIMNMSWNIVVSSSINVDWMTKAVGENFELQTRVLSKDEKLNFYRDCNGKTLISFGNEDNIPDTKELKSIKRKYNSSVLPDIVKNVLDQWGFVVVDGIEEDDWMSLPFYLGDYPDKRIYIFGMTKKQLETFMPDSEDDIGTKIILVEESLNEVLEKLNMIDEIIERPIVDSNIVRVTLPDGDVLWLDRKDITRFENMGITVMRDELMGSLFVDETNIERYFAEFMSQHEKKQWQYFNVRYGTEQFSFHVAREKENDLIQYIMEQSEKQTYQRNICLLSGDSNTGKTTSLSWLAQRIYRQFPGFKRTEWKNGGYVVYYISGDPERKDWQTEFINFVKKEVNGRQTEKGKKIRNNIVIWDNYDSTDNKRDKYFRLFKLMNECNPMLIGSIYAFESASSFSQNEKCKTVTMPESLSRNDEYKFNEMLKKVNCNVMKSDQTEKKRLFEVLMDLSIYFKYSKLWQQLLNGVQERLKRESDSTENTAFGIYQESKQYGIGASIQYQFYKIMDDEGRERNKPLINAITYMNKILAIAGQFNNKIDMPIELLLNMINRDGSYIEPGKLKKILKNDSMVRYKNNVTLQNISSVYFRNPDEALSYIAKTFNINKEKRMEEEIKILLDMIERCRWEDTVQSRAVLGLVRAFGPNSYGKHRTTPANGQYTEYRDYWSCISEKLNDCAQQCNAEAIMVAGQFLREDLRNNESYSDNTKAQILSACREKLKNASSIQNTSPKSSARLFGEICRNIIAQMNYELQYMDDFEGTFRKGIDIALKCDGFSTIQFLDIWLKYINIINRIDSAHAKELIPKTIEYIDILLFSDNSVPDGDYTSVINGIMSFYESIGATEPSDLKKYFENAENDSYIFYKANRELISLYLDMKDTDDIMELENNLGYKITRFFFLNEYSSCKNTDQEEEYLKLKSTLRICAGKVIKILGEDKNKDILRKSRRCLLLYLRAKWMYYTGNFILEIEQVPGLSAEQWIELQDICSDWRMVQGDFSEPPAVSFIGGVCEWLRSENSRWNNLRLGGEQNERILCICNDNGEPRKFQVSFNEYGGKVYATINNELIDNTWTIYTPFAQKKKILVPENIKYFPQNKNTYNCTTSSYTLWFGLSGPRLQDGYTDKRGEYNE